MPKITKVAILDDYQSTSTSAFSQLVSSLSNTDHVLEITPFPETLNPQDPAQKAALIERLIPYEIISTMRERTPFPADVLSALPNLKLLLTTGMRNASLDIEAAKRHGVVVAGTVNQKAVLSPDSTTQHTWALILGLARHVVRDHNAVTVNKRWQGETLATGLPGKTLGLLGLGRLGGATARIAVLAFNMRILAWSTSLTQEKADETAESLGLAKGSIAVADSKEDLFKRADILSVHYVLSSRSRGIIGKKELEVMKPTALLVNTSRGPLIDEDALLDVLEKGGIRGAALDVFNTEPLPFNSRWRTTGWGRDGRSELLLSPHMGYGEETNIGEWYEQTAENVGRWIKGDEVKWRLV